ncbi:MAG: hypothetical protein KJ057_09805 [Phycisphaerae bacterium]|nr:MAG: hypothetical protein EDS66_15900 [Planctomycetota bacterium]MBE7458213.1 hypothetical protein [Planctomycetia bacterium]MCL4718752.1 hypothetical protein [Phycisphaerae bacterium]
MSAILDIANAVVALINGGAYVQPVAAKRLYQPVIELPEAEALTVSVVPKAQAVNPGTRTDDFIEVAVDVAVQKKVTFDASDQAALDELMALVEQIIDRLRHKHLEIGTATPKRALFVSIANEPVFAPDHLEQLRQFTSVITVRYQVRR